MNTGLRNKHVLVTGGSSGIGEVIVQAFLNEDARVTATYLSNRPDKPSSQNEQWLSLDLGNLQSIKQMLADAEDAFGPVNVLVHSAVVWPNELSNVDGKRVSRALKINVEGSYTLVEDALYSMKSTGWGRIVLLSSDLAENGMPGSAIYSGMKAALHGMIKGWMWDSGDADILVNGVLPGLTLTKRSLEYVPEDIREQVRNQTPSGNLSLPKDIANLAVFLSSERNNNITGELIRVSGGK